MKGPLIAALEALRHPKAFPAQSESFSTQSRVSSAVG